MTSVALPAGARLRRTLASTLAEVDPACDEIRALLERHGLDGACFAVELVAREALCNAVVHGNKQGAAKRVRLDVSVGQRWIRVRVADDGDGFDWRRRRMAAPHPAKRSGRGLAACAVYAARVAFNRSGNEITLWIPRKKEDGGG